MEDRQKAQAMLERVGEFKSEPLTNFSVPENAAAFEAALVKVRGQLWREAPPSSSAAKRFGPRPRRHHQHPAHPGSGRRHLLQGRW
jgi:hypothetical protein